MKKNLQNKLKAYSLTAGVAGLAVSAAEAQVNYGDINPDKVINIGTVGASSDQIQIDLDGDGNDDVLIKGNPWGGSTAGGTLYVDALNNNKILGGAAGAPSTNYMSFIAGALDANDNICTPAGGKTWEGGGLLIGGAPGSIVGPWKAKTNKYLGVKIVNVSETLYGWVRMTVDNTMSVTVKDYAATTDDGFCVLAGASTTTGNINQALVKTMNVYSTTDKTVHVEINDVALLQNASVEVVDLQGNVVFRSDISSDKTELNVSNATNGIYLVKLNSDKGVAAKKVYIQ